MNQTPPLSEMFAELATGAATTPRWSARPARSPTASSRTRNRVAHALTDLGVGEKGRVAYLDLNNPEFFEVMVGAAKIGAAIAPLNSG